VHATKVVGQLAAPFVSGCKGLLQSGPAWFHTWVQANPIAKASV